MPCKGALAHRYACCCKHRVTCRHTVPRRHHTACLPLCCPPAAAARCLSHLHACMRCVRMHAYVHAFMRVCKDADTTLCRHYFVPALLCASTTLACVSPSGRALISKQQPGLAVPFADTASCQYCFAPTPLHVLLLCPTPAGANMTVGWYQHLHDSVARVGRRSMAIEGTSEHSRRPTTG